MATKEINGRIYTRQTKEAVPRYARKSDILPKENLKGGFKNENSINYFIIYFELQWRIV